MQLFFKIFRNFAFFQLFSVFFRPIKYLECFYCMFLRPWKIFIHFLRPHFDVCIVTVSLHTSFIFYTRKLWKFLTAISVYFFYLITEKKIFPFFRKKNIYISHNFDQIKLISFLFMKLLSLWHTGLFLFFNSVQFILTRSHILLTRKNSRTHSHTHTCHGSQTETRPRIFSLSFPYLFFFNKKIRTTSDLNFISILCSLFLFFFIKFYVFSVFESH